jgi:hypothetical protein
VNNCNSPTVYGYHYSCYDNSGKYIINRINGYMNKTLNGNSGTLGYNKSPQGGCVQTDSHCNNHYIIGAGNGGDSPYGSSGGVGANVTFCPPINYQETGCSPSNAVDYWTPYLINGSIGSGGGGTYDNGYICVSTYCQYLQNGCFYKIFQQAGYGGNGSIIIYYETQPTSFTPSVSTSLNVNTSIIMDNSSTDPHYTYYLAWFSIAICFTFVIIVVLIVLLIVIYINRATGGDILK